LDAFLVRHDAFEFAEVDHDVVAFEAADGAGHDVAGAVLEFLVDHFLFRLAEALHHRLFGSLDGDASEVLGSDVEFLNVAGFGFGIFFEGGGEGDFVELVLVFGVLNDCEGSEDACFSFAEVDFCAHDFDVFGTGNHFAIGRNEGEFQRSNDLLAVDAFFFFVILDEGDDIVGHGGQCLESGGVRRRKRVGA
jgi:hypothetical protein